MFKKLLVTTSAFAVAVASVPMFAAFEAHVINVTAKIENALFVHPEALEYGTVFPQEHLESQIFISFSQSFSERTQRRANEVEYVIKQKPKPRPSFEQEVGVPAARDWCHDNFVDVKPGVALDATSTQLYLSRCYPSLCPYLSKQPDGTPSPGNDIGVPAFHDPFSRNRYFYGKLLKFNDSGSTIGADPADLVTIDLAVPCFKGACAQDWDRFVLEHNPEPDAPPSDYQLHPGLESEVFGCDLWVEVTEIDTPSTTPEILP